MEAFLTNAMALMIFLTGFALFIGGGSTSVDMKVVGVETSLPIEFFDSLNGGDDIMHYPFELQTQTPLTLLEVKISNGKESKSLKYFEADYNGIGLFGESLSDFVVLHEEPSESLFENGVKLYSITRLMTTDTLEPRHWSEKSQQGTKYFSEDDLNVLFVFKEGTASVHYKFHHQEIMRAPLFPLGS